MTTQTHVQLVTIAPKENDAATIESFLRDHGQPVRMQWLQPNDGLEKRLSDLGPHLIFCDGSNPKLRDYALHCCNKAAAEVPVLLITQKINAQAVETALQKRARDAVSPAHLEHLQAVYMRELAASKLESNLREARSELASLRARMSSIVSVSQLAVAHVQDGILIDASSDFCQLFGYASPDELSSHPFLELVSSEVRPQIKKMFNRCSSGKTQSDELETTGLTAKGEAFPLLLRIAAVETEEGNALELQVKHIEQAVSMPAPAPAPAPAAVVETDVEEFETETMEVTEASRQRESDDNETRRITTALTEKKYRASQRQFILLDGQSSVCSDLLLELQSPEGQWFIPKATTRATAQAQQQYALALIEEACGLLSKQLNDGQPGTVLVPVMPSSLDILDDLKSLLEEQAKPLLGGGQNLVISLNEQLFSPRIEAAQRFADEMRKSGVLIAIDHGRSNPATIKLMHAVKPNYVCLDRSATQLLVSQGSEHPELARIMQFCREQDAHIVAYPLQDAHSMAMLWQRGVNMIRSSEFQLAAA